MSFVGCRGCGFVKQVPEQTNDAAAGRCSDCGQPLERMTAADSREFLKRRLADQRIRRLSRAAMAQQLRLARVRPSRTTPGESASQA